MDHGDYFACYEPQVHLDDWAIVGEANPYQAPECRVMQLTGKVYNHPRFSDGEVVTTSRVVSSSGTTVETHKKTYDLGRIAEEYKERWSSMGSDVESWDRGKYFLR